MTTIKHLKEKQMAIGQTIKDMQDLVQRVTDDFGAIKQLLEQVAASQKRIEATVANLIPKDKK